MAGEHSAKTTSWITAALIIGAAILAALALIFTSWWLFGVAVVVGVVGLILGKVGGIMNDAY